MQKYKLENVLIILVGLFTVMSAAIDWKWFMDHYKSKIWIRLFGYNGARVFYILLGLAIAGGGIYLSF